MRRGRSTRWSVEVIVARPAFHRKREPSVSSPSRDADVTSGFQLDQSSIAVSTSQTTSGSADTSISAELTTGALSLMFVTATGLLAGDHSEDGPQRGGPASGG